MKIVSDNRLKEKIKNQSYDINFGFVKKGEEAKISITIENATHFKTTKTCGCTSPVIQTRVDGHFDLQISYDSNKMGSINQTVVEFLTNNETKKEEQIRFNLTGNIV